ncbi:MAG: glycoside hydrolase family 9 protein, partial [Phycisphaerae bacterium]
VREVHAYGPNILEIVTSDTQLNAAMAGNNGVAWQEGAWKITRLDGTPLHVLQVYRHSLPMQAPSYTSSGSSSNDIIQVDQQLFLVLDQNLGTEDTFSITGPMGTSFLLPYSDQYLETPIVQLNQVGYSPLATERWAYVSGWMGDGGSLPLTNMPATAQVLVQPADPMAVRTSVLANVPITVRSTYDSDTGGEVRQIDLARLPAAEGVKYRVQIPGVGVSWVTAVSQEAVFKTYYILSRALYMDRWAGNLNALSTDWVRPPDHTTVYITEKVYNPAAGDNTFSGTDPTNLPLTMIGGYHDAGDYPQNPAHTTITQDMLDAFNLNPAAFTDNQLTIPESGNGIPDQLDQALWGIKGWICLQDADGGVRAGVQTVGEPTIGYANLDTATYWAYAADADTSARCATLFATAARLVAPYDAAQAADLRTRAIAAYGWAKSHGASSGMLLGGAGELWKLTGITSYKTDFETLWDAGAWTNYNTMQNVGGTSLPDFVLGYVTTLGARADIVASITASLNAAVANSLASIDLDHAHRNPRPAGLNMSWGNGTSMGRYLDPMMVRMQMGNVTPEQQQQYYNDLSLSADYMLGANPFGYCWVSGLGSRSPGEVLWTDSLAFNADGYGQIPGMVVYGPSGGYGGTWTQSARAAFYPALVNNTATSGAFGTNYPTGYQYGDTRLLVESTEFTTHQVQAPTIELFANLVGAGMTPPASWRPGGANVRNPLPGGMTPFNEGPNVTAGVNQGIALPALANLTGTVTDDHFSGTLTYGWSKVSGPGTVTFGTGTQVNTTAVFSTAGQYTLRLTASDGSIAKSDDV